MLPGCFKHSSAEFTYLFKPPNSSSQLFKHFLNVQGQKALKGRSKLMKKHSDSRPFVKNNSNPIGRLTPCFPRGLSGCQSHGPGRTVGPSGWPWQILVPSPPSPSGSLFVQMYFAHLGSARSLPAGLQGAAGGALSC